MMAEDAVVGVTSNPTIFQKAMSEGDWYDDQLREVLAEVDDPKEIFLRLAFDDIREACDLMRKVWDGTGAGRLRLARGRARHRTRHRGDDRAGTALPRRDRQAEPLRQDPGHRRGCPRDRGDDRPWQADQRDADLRPRPLCRGRRGVHPRAGAAGRVGRRPQAGDLGCELLRLTRRIPRPTSGSTRSTATTTRAGLRSRTRSSPISATRSSSPARGGRRWRPGAPRHSAASGPRRPPRTPSTAT